MQKSISQLCQYLYFSKNFNTVQSYIDKLIGHRFLTMSPQHKVNISRMVYKLLDRATDFIDIADMDGLLWMRLNENGFDLIKDNVKFQPKKIEIPGFPKRAHILRKNAIQYIHKKKMFDLSLRQETKTFFVDYLDDIQDKYLCFYRYAPKMDPTPGLCLPVTTRFNDRSKIKLTLDKFDYALDMASEIYEDGVYLTLTTDPNLFDNIWEANRHFSQAWNKFLSYITKRHGKRPRYVASYEYTKESGLMHAHIIIFGLSWLAPHKDITTEWEKCGQGSINHEYVIHNDQGKWHWTRAKPQKCKHKDPTSYLKKYLKKGLFDISSHDLYWLFNKRFMTCSRYFLPKSDQKPARVVFWKFCGVWTLFDVPDIIFTHSNFMYNFLEREKT